DYIGETTIADFEKKTGIKVTYDMYTSSEEMEAKMLAGKTGYDLVDMAGNSLARFIQAGIFQRLDRAQLPSWGNLDPTVLGLMHSWDPDNLYGMPYMWGTTGLTFNVDLVKKRLPDVDFETMDIIFKPELAAKVADCGISLLDSQQDVIRMGLGYLGIDPNEATAADYDKVVELFKPIRQYIRTFDSSNYLNAIPNGELCVINNWSGDYATAKTRAAEAGVKINLAYQVPKSGASIWVDSMCIPADAKNPGNAHKFLEFLLDPAVIAACTDFTNYANANVPAKKLINQDVANDPAIYPDEATLKRLSSPKTLTEEQDRAMTRAFTAIKSG
ncbi:MAG: polyamine ABC transporter substrate-binding protein, partial [Hyphomicrobium sp.]|uniref:polyamine ABC transporter substrate-binding protein n=1 Tax=Hyphomicrobium sp. TaxID=82 RepID=UPI003D0AC51A